MSWTFHLISLCIVELILKLMLPYGFTGTAGFGCSKIHHKRNWTSSVTIFLTAFNTFGAKQMPPGGLKGFF